MESLVRFLLNPFNILLLLMAGCISAWYFKKERLFKWSVAGTIVWFLVVSTPLVPVWLINSLEDRYYPLSLEQISNPEAEYRIIVLGGGHGFDDRLPPNMLLSDNARGRLMEGVRLYHQLPNSKLVLSGYSSSGRTSQAEMLQMTALLLGVEEERTIVQTEPANTYQEAKVYAENFVNSYPVIVVTSATHMPRAVMSFKMHGIDPVPAPTNYRLKGSWKEKRFGFPSISNMRHFHAGVSSYAGMIRYRFY